MLIALGWSSLPKAQIFDSYNWVTWSAHLLHPLQSSGPSWGFLPQPGFWRIRYNAVSLQDNYKRSCSKKGEQSQWLQALWESKERHCLACSRDPFENRPSFSFPWVHCANAGQVQDHLGPQARTALLCSAAPAGQIILAPRSTHIMWARTF